MAQRFPEKDPEQIDEVLQYLNAVKDLEHFREQWKHVFDQYDTLVTRRNDALEAADKAVRGQAVSCGPFQVLNQTTKYDAGRLYELLGRDDFFRVGGVIKSITEFSVDSHKLEAVIAAGEFSQELVDEIKTVGLRYKKPDRLKT